MESTFYRILVMESDSSFTQIVCNMLEDAQNSPFQIVLAEEVQGVVPNHLFDSVDALLLDLSSLDGAGLARLTEIHAQFRSLPILALIAAEEDTLGNQILAAGAAEYLVKETLSPELLRRTLKYAIERTRAENSARQCEQRFHDLFENAKDILFTLDLEGNVTSLNKSAEEVMGWSKMEALQINIKNLVAPEHLNLCCQMMQRILNEEPLQHFEISMLRKDGRKVLLQTSARLLYSNGQRKAFKAWRAISPNAATWKTWPGNPKNSKRSAVSREVWRTISTICSA
jgi:PAS domain S-box-containing protein